MGNVRSGRSTGPEGGGGTFIQYPGTCTAVIGSMTLTLRAQSILADASIRTSVTKISSAKTHHGCAYGLIYPCIQSGNVSAVLSDAGIAIRHVLGEG